MSIKFCSVVSTSGVKRSNFRSQVHQPSLDKTPDWQTVNGCYPLAAFVFFLSRFPQCQLSLSHLNEMALRPPRPDFAEQAIHDRLPRKPVLAVVPEQWPDESYVPLALHELCRADTPEFPIKQSDVLRLDPIREPLIVKQVLQEQRLFLRHHHRNAPQQHSIRWPRRPFMPSVWCQTEYSLCHVVRVGL